MPCSFVCQVSPALMECAAVMVPVVTISLACSGWRPGCFASTSIRCAIAANGLPSTLAPTPVSRTTPLHDSASENDASCRDQIRAQPVDGLRLADQQRSVQRAVGNGVGGLKLPAGKMRLHDFESVRDPVDARQYRREITAGRRRRPEVKDDFGLDLRFGKAADSARHLRGGRAHDGGVVDVRPDRLAHAVTASTCRDW